MTKTYVGDAVYADHDEYHLILTVEYGYGPEQTIYIEPQVWESIVRYVSKLQGGFELVKNPS